MLLQRLQPWRIICRHLTLYGLQQCEIYSGRAQSLSFVGQNLTSSYLRLIFKPNNETNQTAASKNRSCWANAARMVFNGLPCGGNNKLILSLAVDDFAQQNRHHKHKPRKPERAPIQPIDCTVTMHLKPSVIHYKSAPKYLKKYVRIINHACTNKSLKNSLAMSAVNPNKPYICPFHF